MNYINVFRANKALIEKYGVSNAYLIWVMGLYLDYPDIEELASECLTDNGDDKKIDLIKLDLDNKKIVFAQGYHSERKVDSAPANKASDLNTASAWLISGDTNNIPSPLKEIIQNCRQAIENGEIEQIDLLYVHNLSESVSVLKELRTAADHLTRSLPKEKGIVVFAKELGLKETEDLFSEQSSQIVIKEEIDCPAELQYEETGPDWSSGILSIPGSWLREQFLKYGDRLFSANYRGFLGISKRKKINLGIKNTAEREPQNFWAYNNGITILTIDFENNKNKTTKLTGLSIINGAQTTGSLGSLESATDLSNVKVLARVIKCSNQATIDNIIKYNNTQNRITTWDRFSNDSIQKAIVEEFRNFGRNYNLKRGFSDSMGEVGIENVAQSLIALLGNYDEANRGKNGIFDSDNLYKAAFESTKARHILFAYCLIRAIDERRFELKVKKDTGTIIALEEKQLGLLKNLRFKYFFVAVFGKCLEPLLEKKVNIKDVGFTPNSAKAENKSINDLILDLLPVVNIVLTFVSTTINGKELYEVLEEESPADRISTQVGSILYATLNASSNPAIDNFRNVLTTN
jgi:AIPR protein